MIVYDVEFIETDELTRRQGSADVCLYREMNEENMMKACVQQEACAYIGASQRLYMLFVQRSMLLAKIGVVQDLTEFGWRNPTS